MNEWGELKDARSTREAASRRSYVDIRSLRKEELHHLRLTKVHGVVQGFPPAV